MKKLFLTALLAVLSLSSFSADKEVICKILSNQICDNYSCYIISQTEKGKFYFISLMCPSHWEGDPGHAIAQINRILTQYSDLVTIQAFTTNDSGNLEKIMQYDDLTVRVHYLVDSNAIIVSAYNVETE